jgi:hypothetical protein
VALGVVGVEIEQGVELVHEGFWPVVKCDQVSDLMLEAGGFDSGHGSLYGDFRYLYHETEIKR